MGRSEECFGKRSQSKDLHGNILGLLKKWEESSVATVECSGLGVQGNQVRDRGMDKTRS